jgi:EAL and modified HD-GYP domain-containing signal transduction protein
MSDPSVLAQVVLGYSPMIDRERAVTATRLTVFPARPDVPVDAGALLAAVTEVWPEGAGRVSLNVVSETLLHDLLLSRPNANLMVEVPAFMACDLAHSEGITGLYARGNTLLLKGRPRSELPREVLPCFKHSIIDLEDERRADAPPAPGVTRQITHIQAGVRTLADMEASFQRGAVAVLGWPIEDAVKPQVGRPRPARPGRDRRADATGSTARKSASTGWKTVMKNDPTHGLPADALHQLGRPSG